VLPFCHVTLRGHKPYPPGYPQSLKTIGDHIRKRRLDLKLTQKKVAKKIGVDKTTVQFWENNRVKPSLRLIPKIVEFLGYDPHKIVPNNLADKIKAFRRLRGLSLKKLAGLLGIDKTTLASWEKGEHQPSKRLVDNLAKFHTSFH